MTRFATTIALNAISSSYDGRWSWGDACIVLLFKHSIRRPRQAFFQFKAGFDYQTPFLIPFIFHQYNTPETCSGKGWCIKNGNSICYLEISSFLPPPSFQYFIVARLGLNSTCTSFSRSCAICVKSLRSIARFLVRSILCGGIFSQFIFYTRGGSIGFTRGKPDI